MGTFVDLSGQKFNKVTLVRVNGRSAGKHLTYLCACECGTEFITEGYKVKQGHTKSCGCLQKAAAIKNGMSSRKQPMEDRKQAGLNGVLARYRKDANTRKLTWALTHEYACSLLEKNCYYCGCPPMNHYLNKYGAAVTYNGIDRKDNDRGYEPDNVVTCCRICNLGKRNLPFETFVAWIHRVKHGTSDAMKENVL